MKNIAKILAMSAAVCAMLPGCKTEKIDYASVNGQSDAAAGYLSFSDFNLSVANYAEEITSSASRSDMRTKSTTKADVPATYDAGDDYVLRLRNIKTAEEKSFTYGEIKAAASQDVELAPGTYIVSAESPDYKTYTESQEVAQWASPIYYGETTATIESSKSTPLSGLLCRLANIKATVSVTPDLQAYFMSDTECESTPDAKKLSVSLSVDGNSLSYSLEDMAAIKEGYFKAAEQARTIDVVLEGMYNKAAPNEAPSYSAITWKASIPNCKAGQWRKISIGVVESTEGNVQFGLTVQNWTYDEAIDVDVTTYYASLFREEILVDGDFTDEGAPVFSLNGGSIDKGYTLHAGIYDAALGKWLENMRMTLTPTAGSSIASAYVMVSTDNAELQSAFAAYKNGRIPVWALDSSLSPYVVTSKSGDAITYVMTDAGMTSLFSYKGTHTFKLVAEDSEWRTSYTDFTVTCLDGEIVLSGPEIVWTNQAGDFKYDFDQTYKHTEVEILLKATTQGTFTGFEVDIDSDVLTSVVLGAAGLTPHLDLINPGSTKATLQNLGFPVEDEITSSNEVSFDITGFMDLITSLGMEGYCNFTITVTDTNGTDAKTIKLTVEQ